LVYDHLRRLAVQKLRGERSDHTLQPTALVHEAFLRMVDQHAAAWRNRAQFYALAAQGMRRVLVDHARARNADKRAGAWERVTLDDGTAVERPREVDVVALEAALEELQAADPQKVRLVELRFYGGLSIDEAAAALGVSRSTAVRDWRLAKAWLFHRLA
jgi:RNA polymerase sigma factor (TIGR02999 family)